MPDYEEIQPEAAAERMLALGSVLSSGVLGASKRQAELLRYLVIETVEGRSDRIKSYTIAIDVLDRGEDFDPSTDSIVRVEVGRLRASLERYAASLEPGGTYIEIPKGSYVPVFLQKEGSPPGSPFLELRKVGLAAGVLVLIAISGLAFWRLWPTGQIVVEEQSFAVAEHISPRVALVPFGNSTGTHQGEQMAYGIGVELVSVLRSFPWLTIYVDSEPESQPAIPVDYYATGEVGISDEAFEVTIRLNRAGDGQVMWEGSFFGDLTHSDLIAAQREIAQRLAIQVGGRDRVLADLETRRLISESPTNLSSYFCVLSLYWYWESFSESEHKEVRNCLENAVVESPDYADAWAGLAFAYLDESRYGYNPSDAYDPIAKALDAARRGWELSPNSVLASMALYTVHVTQENEAEFLRVGRNARENAPNNPDLLADFGNKASLGFGKWEEGVPLVEAAIDMHPEPPFWYFIAPAFNAYRLGDDAGVIAWTDRMNAPYFVLYQFVRFASFSRMGELEVAEAHRRALDAQGIADLASALERLESIFLHPDLSDSLASGLEAAYGASAAAQRSDLPRLHLVVTETDGASGAFISYLRTALAKFNFIKLFEEEAGAELPDDPEDYRLTIEVNAAGETESITATLVQIATSEVLASESFPVPVREDDSLDDSLRFELVGRIARVMQNRGILLRDYMVRGDISSVMRCILLARAYFDDQTDESYGRALECAETALEEEETAEMHMALAVMNREAFTDGHPSEHEEPIEVALNHAVRATQLSVNNAWAHYILSTIFYATGSRDRMLEEGRRAIELNPYDADIVGGFAVNLAYSGLFEEARENLDQSADLSPGESQWRDHIYFLIHMGTDQPELAAQSANGLAGSGQPIHLAARLIATQYGGLGEAESFIAALVAQRPSIRDDPGEIYRHRNYDPGLIQILVSELRAAGL